MGNKEVRDILLGRIVRWDEQFWAAAPSNARFHFHGLRDGAGDVRLFGVTHLTRRYQIAELDPETAFEEAEKALHSMGRPMRLASLLECKGCLYAPPGISLVLLTIERGVGGLQVTAYTGRSLVLGRIRCHVALWILEQRLPKGITRIGMRKKTTGKKVEKKEKEVSKRVAKRAAPPKKKKAAPKRLKK